ncbi:MAG TPA: EamA family transporter [Edaphocola sp.]|nr:EamA family transporter [Edaphocola sp.]
MNDRKAYMALAVVCVVWGTTYPAMTIGALGLPPLLFAGLRHCSAGICLWIYLLLFLKRRVELSARHILRQAFPGILMFACSNGTINWAEKYIPGGLAALILSVMPVYVVLINLVSGTGKRMMSPKTLLGVILGGVGVALIFRDNLKDLGNRDYLLGILAVFGASLCWTLGTMYIKKYNTQTGDSLVNIAIQMCSGGAVLLVASYFWDAPASLSSVLPESVWALGYLVVFGSLITYLCYVYAVRKLPVGVVSVYTYLNPFIAIVIGHFWLHERITWVTALAFAATMGGVYFINRDYLKSFPVGFSRYPSDALSEKV